MTNNEPAYTFRVSCDCKVCTAQAVRNGVPTPLAALVTEQTGAMVKTRTGRHNLVGIAHAKTLTAGQRIAVPVTA